MIIEKIVIKSFGLIRDMTLEFSSTINVIEGHNEAGKSTIAAFIKYMLYGFEQNEAEGLSERKLRLNWTTGTAEGSMYVSVKGKRYLITRMTTLGENSARSTYKEEATIIDLSTGAPAFGKVPAGEVFFGVDAELFGNTAFVGQIGDSKINEGSVRESIENILFSGAETVNNRRAVAKISDKMELLLHESGHGGTIVDLMRKSEELEDKLKSSDEENQLILVKEAELHDIRMKKADYEDRLVRLHTLNNDYQNAMLIHTFDRLHELEEESEKKNADYNAYIEENTHLGFVPSRDYLTDIAVARQTVNDTYRALTEADAAYAKERGAVGITKEIEGAIQICDECGGEEDVKNSAGSFYRTLVRDISLIVAGGLFAVAAAVMFILSGGNVGLLVGGILCSLAAVGGIAFGVYSYLGARKGLTALEVKFATNSYRDLIAKINHIAEQRNKRDGLLRATENARAAAESARMAYESSKIELANIIIKWGGEPPESDLNGYLDALDLRVREFLDKKDELYTEKCESELTVKEIRKTLSDKSEIDIRAQVPPLRRKALVGVNYNDIIGDINKQKELIAAEEERARDVDRTLFSLKSRAGDPGELYSKIQALDSRIDELRRRHKAYFIARRAIEGASENLRAEISPRLGEYATQLMSVMTDKKYTHFDVSDGLVVTFEAADGEKKSVDFLSGGTRDLAYIAVRLALVDMLYTERPPLCFDESFAHQDNVRAHAMMKALAKLAKEGSQSFIFTCRNRESALATELSKRARVFKISHDDDTLG